MAVPALDRSGGGLSASSPGAGTPGGSARIGRGGLASALRGPALPALEGGLAGSWSRGRPAGRRGRRALLGGLGGCGGATPSHRGGAGPGSQYSARVWTDSGGVRPGGGFGQPAVRYPSHGSGVRAGRGSSGDPGVPVVTGAVVGSYAVWRLFTVRVGVGGRLEFSRPPALRVQEDPRRRALCGRLQLESRFGSPLAAAS